MPRNNCVKEVYSVSRLIRVTVDESKFMKMREHIASLTTLLNLSSSGK